MIAEPLRNEKASRLRSRFDTLGALSRLRVSIK